MAEEQVDWYLTYHVWPPVNSTRPRQVYKYSGGAEEGVKEFQLSPVASHQYMMPPGSWEVQAVKRARVLK